MHSQPSLRRRPSALRLSRNPTGQQIALAWAAAVLRSPTTPSPPPLPPKSPIGTRKNDDCQVAMDMDPTTTDTAIAPDLPALARARNLADLHRSSADWSERYKNAHSQRKPPDTVCRNNSVRRMNPMANDTLIKKQGPKSSTYETPIEPPSRIASNATSSNRDRRRRSQSLPDLMGDDLWEPPTDTTEVTLNSFVTKHPQCPISNRSGYNGGTKTDKQPQPGYPGQTSPPTQQRPVPPPNLPLGVSPEVSVPTTTANRFASALQRSSSTIHRSSSLAGQLKRRPSGFLHVPKQGSAPPRPLRSPYRIRSSSVATPAPVCRMLRIVLSARDYITMRVPADITLRALTSLAISKCRRCGRPASDLDYRIFIWERPAPDRTLGVMNDAVLQQVLGSLSPSQQDVSRPIGSSPDRPEETITLYWT